MRWKQLFADLSAQFEEAASAGQRGDVAARARTEAASVTLAERGRGSLGTQLALEGRGAGWGRGRGGLGRAPAAPEDGPVRIRLDLRRALRGLARDRSAVLVVLDDGTVL